MSENVRVAASDEYTQGEVATLLLAAVEELGLPAGVVTVDTTGSGPNLSAPAEVVKKAGLKAEDDEAEEVSDELDGPTAEFFRNAKKGDPKPEQAVSGDSRPGATVDPGPTPNPMGDGQAGEATETKAAAARAEADQAPAKKAVAKKAAAKKSTTAKK
jgi:hypothetical protein